MKWQKWTESLLNAFFPKRCAFCGGLRFGQDVCPACAWKLNILWQGPPQKSQPPEIRFVDGLAVCYSYRRLARYALLQLKYAHSVYRAPVFGAKMAQRARESRFPMPAMVIPVPGSRAEEKRGGGTSQLLAAEVARHFSLPCRDNLLYKKFKTLPQHTLSSVRRQSNLCGAYGMRHPEQLRGCTVWLVDDVVTTGSTLRECAKTLWLYGAEKIYALSFCGAFTKKHSDTIKEQDYGTE